MSDIEIKRINESFVYVNCEDVGIYYELNDSFSFYVDGYKFMPKYRNGLWSGKVYLFNMNNKTTYYGLIGQLIKFAKYNGYSISFCDDINKNFDEVQYDFSDLNLPFEPYGYQVNAINKILNNKKRLIVSPTGSGKSLIIYCSVRKIMEQGKKILIVVPTVSLVEQLYKDFVDYGWNSLDEHVHKIYSGKEKNNSYDVTLTTWQSIFKLNKNWFEDFDAVFIDEAHLASANSLKGIMEKSVNAQYRVGLTGTVQDAKANKLTLIGLFGEPYDTIKSKKLMDDGVLSDLKINALILNHIDVDKKAVSKMKYQEELNVIVEDRKRNNLILNLAVDQEYNTLILFNYVERHGEKLYSILLEKCQDKKIFLFMVTHRLMIENTLESLQKKIIML